MTACPSALTARAVTWSVFQRGNCQRGAPEPGGLTAFVLPPVGSGAHAAWTRPASGVAGQRRANCARARDRPRRGAAGRTTRLDDRVSVLLVPKLIRARLRAGMGLPEPGSLACAIQRKWAVSWWVAGTGVRVNRWFRALTRPVTP